MAAIFDFNGSGGLGRERNFFQGADRINDSELKTLARLNKMPALMVTKPPITKARYKVGIGRVPYFLNSRL